MKRILSLVIILSILCVVANYSSILQYKSDKSEPDVIVSEPVFSSESGIYNKPFYLKLGSAPNTKIYYTLDSSEPDENSIEYTGSILIKNVSDSDNVYSMLTNTSAGFYSDLIEKYKTNDADPMYKAPDFPVKKCVVVRAVAVDENGNFSNIKTNAFIVDENMDFYSDCNIISIVTSPENLFDDRIGIYVTGDIFDNYVLKKNMDEHWRFWEANYRQKGKKWERPVDFTIFNNKGKLLLSTNGGVRVQGGVSRGTLPRNLNLYTGEKYSKTSSMNNQLFSGNFTPTKVTLSAGGNRNITLFNDRMMSDRTQSLNFAKMSFEPYVLFLDGEYWGFYWLTNSYNERYISYNYGVAEDNIVMIKNGDLEIGDSNDALLYDNMKKYIEETDMSISTNYEQACELIDIDSFLDYYACLAYIARKEDWPTSNYALWRSRNVDNGTYSDGKWRWMLFDCNSSSMREDLITHDTLSYIIQLDSIFSSLWNNADFRAAFEKRIFEIADECFDSQEMSNYIDDYSKKMPNILQHSWARFYGSNNTKENEFHNMMDEHRNFFNNRRKVVETWFK